MKIKKLQSFGILSFFVWMPIPMLDLDPPEFLAGQPGELSSTQKRLIPDLLSHEAEAYGFRGDVTHSK